MDKVAKQLDKGVTQLDMGLYGLYGLYCKLDVWNFNVMHPNLLDFPCRK